MLTLDAYRDALQLDVPFTRQPAADDHHYPQLVLQLLTHFIAERGISSGIPDGVEEQRRLLQALLTQRLPVPIELERWRQLGALFHHDLRRRGQVDIAEMASVSDQFPCCSFPDTAQTILWQGDISLLNADAITNAANSDMLGCFQPFHRCIDNVIHNCAGPQLRDDCARLMRLQGKREAAGHAKITRAYYLPSRFVVHTVGPIVSGGKPSAHQQQQLSNCYRACLDVSAQLGSIESLVLCCISTGVFGYPQEQAARVALETVVKWRRQNPNSRLKTVLFNVFRDDDLDIYRRIIEQWPAQAEAHEREF
jgi:O-acetyl-ADP-ribose deacetylase (regulator of RNase III)